MADEGADFHIRGHDDTEDAARSAVRSIEDVQGIAVKATKAVIDATLGAEQAMVRLANSTNATKERVTEMYREVQKLAGQTSFGTNALQQAMREFGARTGLRDRNLSQVFTAISKAANVAEIDVGKMSQGVAVAMRRLKIPIEEAGGLFLGLAGQFDDDAKYIVASLASISSALENLNLTGSKNLKEFIVASALLTKATGDPERSIRTLVGTLSRAADTSSTLAKNLSPVIQEQERAKLSTKEFIDLMFKQMDMWRVWGTSSAERRAAAERGFPQDEIRAWAAYRKNSESFTELQKEQAVAELEGLRKQQALEDLTIQQLKKMGVEMAEVAVAVGGLLSSFEKLLAAVTGQKAGFSAFADDLHRVAEDIKGINEIIGSADFTWRRLFTLLGVPSGLMAPDPGKVKPEEYGPPISAARPDYSRAWALRPGGFARLLRENTEALLGLMGVLGEKKKVDDSAKAKGMAFTPGAGDFPWPSTAMVTTAGLKPYTRPEVSKPIERVADAEFDVGGNRLYATDTGVDQGGSVIIPGRDRNYQTSPTDVVTTSPRVAPGREPSPREIQTGTAVAPAGGMFAGQRLTQLPGEGQSPYGKKSIYSGISEGVGKLSVYGAHPEFSRRRKGVETSGVRDPGDEPGSASIRAPLGMSSYPEEAQGIAVADPTQVGAWKTVTAASGQTFTERVTDVGPGIRLGKIADVSAAASVRHLGIRSESAFPTGSVGKVEAGQPSREQLEQLHGQGLLVRRQTYGELGGPEARGDVEKQRRLQKEMTSIGPWQTQVGLTSAESDFPREVTEHQQRIAAGAGFASAGVHIAHPPAHAQPAHTVREISPRPSPHLRPQHRALKHVAPDDKRPSAAPPAAGR